MKRFVLFFLILGGTVPLFAQARILEHNTFASGNWIFSGNRLYQNDAEARLAKANFLIPQSGPMIYEFNVRYEDGAQDGHGGFGIHIYTENVLNRASWGSGQSYLLWLNYDENPVSKDFIKGFSAQVYRSDSNSYMELLDSFDLNQYAHLLSAENLAGPIPFKIWVDGNSGEVRVYDPTDPDLMDYLYFYLPRNKLPLKGNWVSLRTNGLKLSFAMGL